MSEFAKEFKRVVKEKEVLPEASASTEETPAVDHSGAAVFNVHETKEEPTPTLAEAAPEGKAPKVDTAPPPPAKIKIGTQEFADMEAAIKYANDLEIATREQEAFERGKKSATPEAPPTPEPDELEGIEEELFVDPKKAIKKIVEITRNNTLKEVKKEKTEEQKQQEAAAKVKETWDNFYKQNSDLSNNQEFVQFVLQKNPQLLAMETDKALAELASKTRSYLGSVRESQLPTKELQSKPVIAPSGSAPATATKAPPTEKAVDFISQVRNLNRNKAAST